MIAAATDAGSSTPPSTPLRLLVSEVASSPASPAEVLELLADQSPSVAKLPCNAPPPLVFPTGGPLYQEKLPGAIPVHFFGWCLEGLDGVGESQERSGEILERLEVADRIERSQLIGWISKAARPLSLSKWGCRVVQKALEVASSTDRDALVAKLDGFVEDLYDSPHGNHVLSKIVEVMPSASIGCVIAKLVGKGTTVARHRFGCRVLERLIEHCDESQIGTLIDEIVAESAALSKHAYGNFVVQHLMEHLPSRRASILEGMLQDLPMLGNHRHGSHVVQKVMEHCDEEGKEAIISALLHAESPNTLVEVACSRYGSFVVEQLAGMSEAGNEVKQAIVDGRDRLSDSPFGFRVLEHFDLARLEEPPASPSGASKL